MLVVGKYPVFGAVPPAQQAPTEVIRPSEITDRVLRVGPFMMNPEGDVLEFSLASFATRFPGEYQDFKDQFVRVSAEACKMAHLYMGGAPGAGCFPKYRSLHVEGKLIYRPLVDGAYPLYRVDNPVHPNEAWGLYVEFIGDGDVFGHFVIRRVKLTFKRVPQSWWSKLWDFLVKLVGVIVSLVKDILVGLLKGLCQQAQAAGQQLSAVAEGQAVFEPRIPTASQSVVSLQQQTAMQSYGIPAATLAKFAGGGLTSTMLRSVATSLAGSLCESLTEGQYPPGSFAVFTGTEYRIFIPAT